MKRRTRQKKFRVMTLRPTGVEREKEAQFGYAKTLPLSRYDRAKRACDL